ncbi:MAG: glycine zipper family protein [Flavobacterium sp.]|nr:glycine zipper family protein [Flavobacterium sp.]
MKKTILIFSATLLFISCKHTGDEAGVVEDNKSGVIDSMKTVLVQQKMEMAKQKSIDSMKIIVNNEQKKQITKTRYINTNSSNNSQVVAETPKRKKWSGAAKGAVIGAGVGAITGAIVSDKKGEGAIIGGLAGAGIGAGTGAIIDGSKK